MPRVHLVEEQDMSPDELAQYRRFPANLTRGLLLTERRLATALPNLANALRASGFDPKLREGAILRVAALSNSAYERMQHLDQARKVGWSDDEIADIEQGDPARLPSDFQALLPFIDECVATGQVGDARFAEAKTVLSDGDVATLILLIGHYMMVARFVAILGIPLDAKPDSWTAEH